MSKSNDGDFLPQLSVRFSPPSSWPRFFLRAELGYGARDLTAREARDFIGVCGAHPEELERHCSIENGTGVQRKSGRMVGMLFGERRVDRANQGRAVDDVGDVTECGPHVDGLCSHMSDLHRYRSRITDEHALRAGQR